MSKTNGRQDIDKNAIAQFYARLHGPEGQGWLVVWTRQDKATRAFDLREAGAMDLATNYCVDRAARNDVYAAVGLQGQQPQNGSRGVEKGVIAVPGVWADIDIEGPAHKAANLPKTEEEALNLVAAVGLAPSIIVRSGFGLQVYWLYREPLTLESEHDWAVAKSRSTRFQALLRQIAGSRGWAVDPTADLCRVLRVPGTFNRKIRGDARLVTADYFEGRYNASDFEDLLEGAEAPESTSPVPLSAGSFSRASLPPILEGCAWMRQCRDDAATLPEPEWYRMLTVVARCQDAERWAHELSKDHPKYTKRETNTKLKQASCEAIAPTTCAYVHSNLSGERFCGKCAFRGNVNSPIAIGRIGDASREPISAGHDATPTETPVKSQASKGAQAASRLEKYTDLGNARRFVDRYRGTVLYCDAWGKWFVWDTKVWREDRTREVFQKAGDLIRSLHDAAKDIQDKDEREAFLSHLRRSESYRALNAMVTLAKSDRSLARTPDDFDGSPWLLTTESGTLDLRTGKLRPHDPRDLITKLAPVAYDPSASCPNWLDFLAMIMNGRRSLVEFIQRAFGTCLTGVNSDKAMFILYGAGGDNGKSTMVDVFQSILGDYALRTPVETFLRKKEGAIPNDVARLKGARFVWASENDRGTRLSEALIKEMTGGDRMSARFMRAEFFEFYPEFKPWLATNHKPQVRGDQAIWRRLKLVPFDVTIPVEKQKPRHEVMKMFRAEFPGILTWAVKGCLEWQRSGLGVPEEVVAATREYEAEQDTFTMFLDEKCVRAAGVRAASIVLYRAYTNWAEEHGENPASHKMFASFMSERSFQKNRTMNGIVYLGIGLRADESDAAAQRPGAVPSVRGIREAEGEEV